MQIDEDIVKTSLIDLHIAKWKIPVIMNELKKQQQIKDNKI